MEKTGARGGGPWAGGEAGPKVPVAASPQTARGLSPQSGVKAVAVNPGRAVRLGGGGGSVAWLDVAAAVAPAATAAGGDDDEGLATMDVDGAGAVGVPHAVEARARVEVVRL